MRDGVLGRVGGWAGRGGGEKGGNRVDGLGQGGGMGGMLMDERYQFLFKKNFSSCSLDYTTLDNLDA